MYNVKKYLCILKVLFKQKIPNVIQLFLSGSESSLNKEPLNLDVEKDLETS